MIAGLALVLALATSATTMWFVIHQARRKTVEQMELERAQADLDRLRASVEHLLPTLARTNEVIAELAQRERQVPEPDS